MSEGAEYFFLVGEDVEAMTTVPFHAESGSNMQAQLQFWLGFRANLYSRFEFWLPTGAVIHIRDYRSRAEG